MKKKYSIKNNAKAELEINKSKFISFIYKIHSISDIDNLLKEKVLEFNKANHVCYAYDLSGTVKHSDDGEPTGTAGPPILEIIKKHNLCDVIIIVVRFFGGKKLGAGGLIRAYTKSANLSVAKAIKTEVNEYNTYIVSLNYENYNGIFLSYLGANNIVVLENTFEENVDLKVAVLKDNATEFEKDFNSTFVFENFEFYESVYLAKD